MSEHLADTNVGNIEYIRKQDAIDDLHTQLMYRMGTDDMKRRLDDWVKTLPSTDVAPVVHGRWEKKKDSGLFYCSECGLPSMHKWPYCEQCGAKMDGEE